MIMKPFYEKDIFYISGEKGKGAWESNTNRNLNDSQRKRMFLRKGVKNATDPLDLKRIKSKVFAVNAYQSSLKLNLNHINTAMEVRSYQLNLLINTLILNIILYSCNNV